MNKGTTLKAMSTFDLIHRLKMAIPVGDFAKDNGFELLRDAATELERLQARADLAAERELELVEAAYREGHSDGVRACSAQHQTPTDVVDLDWFESRARSGLYKEQLDEQGSDADG